MNDPEVAPHVAEMRRFTEVVRQVMPPVRFAGPEDVVRNREWVGGGAAAYDAAGEDDLDVTEPTLAGVPVRVIRPERVAAAYLHLHGGGWTMGSPRMADTENAVLARCGFAVVSVDYRLAPEHPYPAAVDDCVAVAGWLLDGGARSLGAERCAIGGESAGATLAALTLLRLRASGTDPRRFAAANLVYGVYDMSMTPSQRRAEDTPILDRTYLEQTRPLIFPGRDAERRRDPEVSALYADLAGLPRALFTVGTQDPFLDDSLFMAARWEAAGNDARLHVYPEAPHGFTAFPTPMAEVANRRCREFLCAAAGVPS